MKMDKLAQNQTQNFIFQLSARFKRRNSPHMTALYKSTQSKPANNTKAIQRPKDEDDNRKSCALGRRKVCSRCPECRPSNLVVGDGAMSSLSLYTQRSSTF